MLMVNIPSGAVKEQREQQRTSRPFDNGNHRRRVWLFARRAADSSAELYRLLGGPAAMNAVSSDDKRPEASPIPRKIRPYQKI
ncbi:hypothetical protein L596_026646 [Steinernema carpocapsae]|uniref:Uncharacterized protein n=1 Tax=Steinernema carpocapsae TaxID=34508 RepID=A0A4V5ZY82_STECR|nr:hypothetical protein L596_026646 [Steinernema carpocapsae]